MIYIYIYIYGEKIDNFIILKFIFFKKKIKIEKLKNVSTLFIEKPCVVKKKKRFNEFQI